MGNKELDAAAKLYKDLTDKDTPIGKAFGEQVEDGVVSRAHQIAKEMDEGTYDYLSQEDDPLNPLVETLAQEIRSKRG